MRLLIEVLGLPVHPDEDYEGSTIYNPDLNSFVFNGIVKNDECNSWAHEWVVINVHEFAFKCKEWAFKQYGVRFVSGRSVEDSHMYFCSIMKGSEYLFNSLSENEVDAVLECSLYLREKYNV